MFRVRFSSNLTHQYVAVYLRTWQPCSQYGQWTILSTELIEPGQMLASVVGEPPWPCWLDWVGARFNRLNAALFWCYVLPPSRRLRSSLSSTWQQPDLCEGLGYPLVCQMAPGGDAGELNWNLTPHCLQSGSGHVVHILTLNIPLDT